LSRKEDFGVGIHFEEDKVHKEKKKSISPIKEEKEMVLFL
jgi:hypothetical protein